MQLTDDHKPEREDEAVLPLSVASHPADTNAPHSMCTWLCLLLTLVDAMQALVGLAAQCADTIVRLLALFCSRLQHSGLSWAQERAARA
jgi:hypothetical protein